MEDFFGKGPSEFACTAADLFLREGVKTLLELGSGQGRDTLYFAQQSFAVTALDYSDEVVAETAALAKAQGFGDRLRLVAHDVREPLPFPDESFDAVYSHMLLCMELTETEIASVLREMRRVLKPGGLALYSVRSDRDAHYRKGVHLGEDIYEVGEFVVHFFSEAKIRRLARGYDLLDVGRMTEGSLPRDLYVVAMRKNAAEMAVSLAKEGDMTSPMDKFQEFFDATRQGGVLDARTKGLAFLAASLAAGCEL
jgi:SAM-dependent methyltransferase